MDQWGFEDLLEALNSDDPEMFSIARAILVSMGDTAIPLIRRVVRRVPAHTRQRMAIILSQINSKGAVDVLVELLADSDWSVRVTAALGLGVRGDRRATEVLGPAFEEASPPTRGEIVTALAAIGDTEATKLIIVALGDDEPLVRAKAAYAIANVAQRRSVQPAARDSLRSESERLLSQTLKDSDKGAREAAVTALAAIHGENALGMISEAFQDKSVDVRLAAIRALVITRTKLPARARQMVQQGLMQALKDEAVDVQLTAVEALKPVHKRDKEVIKALAAVYKRDEDKRIRKAAGDALGDQRPKALREQPAFKTASALLVMAFLGWILVSVGGLLYQPHDPLPAMVSTWPAEGIYGPNETVTSWSQTLLSAIDEQREAIASLQPAEGEAFRIPCLRQAEDLLFRKKNCDALIFRANSSTTALTLRFLVLRDRGQVKSIAVGISRSDTGSPDGDFIELPGVVAGEHPAVVGELRSQVLRMLGTLESKDWVEYPPRRKGVYLPFVADSYYQRKIEDLRQSNRVVQHLLALAAEFNPDLSLGARVFRVDNVGPTGMYRSGFRIIQRPMFLEPVLARTLAHELVHAILDGVEDKELLLEQVLPSLKSAHPQMFQITLPLFYYEEEIAAGSQRETTEAEEAIAFFTGSLAAEETQVYFLVRKRPLVTDISDVVWLNEPLLASDIELLVQLGLVPEWMGPKTLGYSEDRITRRYYERVNKLSHLKR